MQTPDVRRNAPFRWRWGTPLFAVGMGVAYLVAGWLGDDLEFGVMGLVLMTGVGLGMLVLGRYSETVAGLLNPGDERINSLDSRATVFAGMVLLAAVLLGFIVEIAQGQDGMPYAALGAIAGVSYVGALIVLRFRR